MKKKQLIFDHDGGVDDFLSLLLLLSMDHIDIKGISISPADCYAENAFQTTLKLLQFTGRQGIPVAVSQYHGINAFPAAWRAAPKVLNAFPALINIDVAADILAIPESTNLFTSILQQTEEPITVLMTGPCSNLVAALKTTPALKNKIEEVIWMGGAIDVPGNVKIYNSNGSQEWNVFWDPVSAKTLFELGLNIVLVPLDATNAVPVSFEFLKCLAEQSNFPWANLAAQFWATTVATIPSYDTIYFMWDVLTSSYLAIPHIFQMENMELAVVPHGAAAGRTIRKPGSGQWTSVAKHADTESFYAYIIRQFSR